MSFLPPKPLRRHFYVDLVWAVVILIGFIAFLLLLHRLLP